MRKNIFSVIMVLLMVGLVLAATYSNKVDKTDKGGFWYKAAKNILATTSYLDSLIGTASISYDSCYLYLNELKFNPATLGMHITTDSISSPDTLTVYTYGRMNSYLWTGDWKQLKLDTLAWANDYDTLLYFYEADEDTLSYNLYDEYKATIKGLQDATDTTGVYFEWVAKKLKGLK